MKKPNLSLNLILNMLLFSYIPLYGFTKKDVAITKTTAKHNEN